MWGFFFCLSVPYATGRKVYVIPFYLIFNFSKHEWNQAVDFAENIFTLLLWYPSISVDETPFKSSSLYGKLSAIPMIPWRERYTVQLKFIIHYREFAKFKFPRPASWEIDLIAIDYSLSQLLIWVIYIPFCWFSW